MGDTPSCSVSNCASTLCVGAIHSSAIWRDWSVVLDSQFGPTLSQAEGNLLGTDGDLVLTFWCGSIFLLLCNHSISGGSVSLFAER